MKKSLTKNYKMEVTKTALITGITGQDGSYLAELLLGKGYEVHGIIRRSSSFNTGRIDHIFDQLHLHFGDLTDSLSIDRIIQEVKPDEVYHLGAQSHVRVSFDVPKYTLETDAAGTLHMLEAIRNHCPKTKFYNATTSELFGEVQEIPQKETTPFYPRSPYGVAKIYSFWITKNYRESYGIYAVNGILFNHESERRGSTFVTKKITEGLARYMREGVGFNLGNMEAKRDWGYAPEFVEGMVLMLQQEDPEDIVLATGETHTIKEFVEECIKYIGTFEPFKDRKFEWVKDSEGRDNLKDVTNDVIVIGVDPRYYRPAEVNLLIGDASKAKEKLGWEAATKFSTLVEKMMYNDLFPA